MNQYYVVWVRNILKCYNYQTYQRNQQQTGFIIADSSDFPIAQCSRISLFVHFIVINIFIFIDKTQTMHKEINKSGNIVQKWECLYKDFLKILGLYVWSVWVYI